VGTTKKSVAVVTLKLRFLPSVVVKESDPALLFAPIRRPLGHVGRHSRAAWSETELPEFCMNLSSAPAILQCEALSGDVPELVEL